MNIPADDFQAVAVVSAIHSGNVEQLRRLLHEAPSLATARVVDDRGVARTLLHVVADWPGHRPNAAASVAVLIAAGADANAAVNSASPTHQETPLHWAASSDDLAALDALLDGGADIEAPGAVFTGGTAMSDAVIFAQWRAARRLLERGAQTTLSQAAALGLLDRVKESYAGQPPPLRELTGAFWHACRGGQRQTAEYLLAQGAELNWIGWDNLTPLDAAGKSGDRDLIAWLRSQGARSNSGVD